VQNFVFAHAGDMIIMSLCQITGGRNSAAVIIFLLLLPMKGVRSLQVSITQVSETVIPENAQRQAHQDRSQSGQPFALRDISDGRSGCAADALSGNTCPNPAVAFFDNTCEAGMMCGTAENLAEVMEGNGGGLPKWCEKTGS